MACAVWRACLTQRGNKCKHVHTGAATTKAQQLAQHLLLWWAGWRVAGHMVAVFTGCWQCWATRSAPMPCTCKTWAPPRPPPSAAVLSMLCMVTTMGPTTRSRLWGHTHRALLPAPPAGMSPAQQALPHLLGCLPSTNLSPLQLKPCTRAGLLLACLVHWFKRMNAWPWPPRGGRRAGARPQAYGRGRPRGG